MQVHELATRAAVAPHVVRYYARLGLLRPTRNPRNKYKDFSQDDLLRLVFIRKAKWLGFTLGEVRLVLEMSYMGKTPCPLVREVVRRRVVDNSSALLNSPPCKSACRVLCVSGGECRTESRMDKQFAA